MKIDFSYIVNLNSSTEEIIDKIKKIPFPYKTSYYVFPAINGWKVVDKPKLVPHKFKVADWWKINSDNDFWNRDVTPGEVGCTLSHYQCIKSAYASGFSGILMLEEDFIPQGKFPTEEILKSIPKDASIVYLDRNKVPTELAEERINDDLTRAGYSYNCHAYLVTRKGMKEIISSNLLDNILPIDEFYSAASGFSNRADVIAKMQIKGFKQYAFNGGYFTQSSNRHTHSLTEFPPEVLNAKTGKTGNKTKYNKPTTMKLNLPIKTPDRFKNQSPILDASNFETWSDKYIQPMVRKGEYDLLTDEPGPNIYTFPFFTKAFCDELIELGEQQQWKNDRHEFYPTTDNLLSVLGMESIYNKVINTYVRPLALWAYGLEGKSWDNLRDESFIIRYKSDEQSHLSLHHDYSNITTLVNLNPGEFKGGGTYFPKYKLNVNPTEMGVMTLHPGNITHKHGARPVTEGTRYVVVSFIKGSAHH
tara:strand:+ start:688 stop:2112 length:1425 start_codon:yes stop_codon:yes gene_type:complete